MIRQETDVISNVLVSSNVMVSMLVKYNIALFYFTTLMLPIKCYGSQAHRT